MNAAASNFQLFILAYYSNRYRLFGLTREYSGSSQTTRIVPLLVLLFLLQIPSMYGQGTQFEAAVNEAIQLRAEDETRKQAIAAFEKVITALKTSDWTGKDTLLGKAYHHLGITHFIADDLLLAIENYEQAVKIREAILPFQATDILKSKRNIGNAYIELENFQAAKTQYQAIIDTYYKAPTGKDAVMASIFLEQAFALTQLEDFKQAEDYLKTGLSLTETHFGDDFYRLAHAYNRATIHYTAIDDGDNIIAFARKTIQLYLDLGDLEYLDSLELVPSYINLGIGYEANKDYTAAIAAYQTHLDWDLGNDEARIAQLADTYNNLADLFRTKRDYQAALDNINKAISYDKQLSFPQKLAISSYNRAEIYLESGDYQKALADYQNALQLYSFDFKPETFIDNPSIKTNLRGNKGIVINILTGKAQALYQYALQQSDEQLLENALATYDTATAFLDQMRTGFQSDKSKRFLAKQAKRMFEAAIKVCLTLYKQTQNSDYQNAALAYAERSKSLILLEAVRKSNAKKTANVSLDWIAQELRVKQTIAAIEQQLFEANQEEETDSLHLQLINLQREQEKLVRELEQKNPAYFQLAYKLPLPTIQQIQSNLNNEQAIVEYLLGEEEIYCFYIDKTTFRSSSIALDFPLKTWVQDFRSSIYDPFLKQNADEDGLAKNYTTLGYQLYEKLLKNILADSDKKRLCIVPDGLLGYLPFDAVLTRPINNELGQYMNYPFLQQAYQLSYNYSIALLEEMNQARYNNTSEDLLAFAPSFHAREAFYLGNTKISLPPLLSNVMAVNNLLEIVEGRKYIQDAALKDSFLLNAANYRYLHFASHAQMNDENADYSFISFSQMGDTIDTNQLLFVSELYTTPLQADMVVLSACETALGELSEGEGIISLARAFSYAGAKSIITTLWRVNDQKTATLITDFYTHLKSGDTKDIALHKAKKDMIQSGFYAHPYYWSGFVPIGNMDAIQQNNYFIFILGGLLLFLLLFLIIRTVRG